MTAMAQSLDQQCAGDIETTEDARALCSAVGRAAALLAELIDRETELVAGGRAHEIEQFQGDKAELSAEYLKQMMLLKRNAATVQALAHDELSALRPPLQELGAKLLRNQDALAAILSVSERLIRAAALKAVDTDSGPKTYGRDAQVAATKVANPAAAMDRRL